MWPNALEAEMAARRRAVAAWPVTPWPQAAHPHCRQAGLAVGPMAGEAAASWALEAGGLALLEPLVGLLVEQREVPTAVHSSAGPSHLLASWRRELPPSPPNRVFSSAPAPRRRSCGYFPQHWRQHHQALSPVAPPQPQSLALILLDFPGGIHLLPLQRTCHLRRSSQSSQQLLPPKAQPGPVSMDCWVQGCRSPSEACSATPLRSPLRPQDARHVPCCRELPSHALCLSCLHRSSPLAPGVNLQIQHR
mmetsp:Transcript_92587/g.167280  ORF Transcript_92587/g.167280 Transcript_92587/m.167280 type:complete len:249 (-) Transcript_92587:398-1144(-)